MIPELVTTASTNRKDRIVLRDTEGDISHRAGARRHQALFRADVAKANRSVS